MRYKKRLLAAALAVVLVVVGIFYYQIYRTPALRFRGQLFPLTETNENSLLYESDLGSISITQVAKRTSIVFQYKWYGVENYTIVDKTDYIEIYGDENNLLFSGQLKDDEFINTDGTANQQLAGLRKLSVENPPEKVNPPNAADAAAVYYDYPTAVRGKREVVPWLVAAFLFVLFAHARLDAGAIWEPRGKYSKVLLENYQKDEKSEEYHKILRMLALSWVLFLIACVGILVWGVLP